MSGRWFRTYDDALHDPKVQSLPPILFKFWFNLLCVASKNDGVIPPLSELQHVLKARSNYLEAHIQALLKRGLIDEVNGRMEPHNWRKRQYKSDVSTPRVQAHRNAKRNVSETPPEYREQIQKEVLGADAPTPISKSKRPTAIPEGFALDDAMRKFAGDRGYVGVNAERMFERFLNHHAAKGSRFASWPAAWRTWVGNQQQFDAQRNPPALRRVPDV